MGNYSAGMEGMPNIFNFIPESKSSGMNDLPGLLALTRDGNNNNDNGWGGQWAVWLIFILAFCNGGWGGFGNRGGGLGGVLSTPEVSISTVEGNGTY